MAPDEPAMRDFLLSLGTRVADFALWGSLAVVSAALLVLLLTRWGNARTTHKCVWLSIGAHLVLVLYACQMRWWQPAAGTPGVDVEVPVQWIAEFERLPQEDLASTEKQIAAELALALPGLTAGLSPPQLLPDDRLSDVAKPAAEPNLANEISPPELLTEAARQALPLSDLAPVDGAPLETDAAVSPDDPAPAVSEHMERASKSPSVEAAPNSEESSPRTISSGWATAVAPPPTPPDFYALREPLQRRATALRRGGTEGTEQAVDDALRWLAAQQQTDGRWNPRLTEAGRELRVLGHDRQGAGADADTAITGLALLAFLGGGHHHLQGEYSDNVRRGLEFIVGSQATNGHLAGDASLFAHMYSHGIASLAVSEAFAMSGDQRLKPFVERAVAYCVSAQDPRGGGWRYQSGEPGDMSQFGWQLMALKSAQLGGVSVPSSTVQRMNTFLASCASGPAGGLASYRPRQAPSPTMTAESLVCRYFLGQPFSDELANEAAEFIARQPPGTGDIDYYLWYYGTLALYQRGGDAWPTWNRALQRQLTSTQVRRGHQAGSWEPNGKWCGYGGRVFSTALATMCLEVYYRYLPVVREQVAWRNGDVVPRRP